MPDRKLVRVCPVPGRKRHVLRTLPLLLKVGVECRGGGAAGAADGEHVVPWEWCSASTAIGWLGGG